MHCSDPELYALFKNNQFILASLKFNLQLGTNDKLIKCFIIKSKSLDVHYISSQDYLKYLTQNFLYVFMFFTHLYFNFIEMLEWRSLKSYSS